MNRILLAAALLLAASPVFATNKTVSWTRPTQYEDNSTLPIADIANYAMEFGTCSGTGSTFGTAQGEVLFPGGATESAVHDFPVGVTCIRMKTIATNGQRSPNWSLTVRVTIAAPTLLRPRRPEFPAVT